MRVKLQPMTTLKEKEYVLIYSYDLNYTPILGMRIGPQIVEPNDSVDDGSGIYRGRYIDDYNFSGWCYLPEVELPDPL